MRRKYLALSSALETVVQDLDERRHVRDLGVVETLLLPALAVVGHFVAVHIARVLTRKVVKKQDLARGVLRIPSFGMGIALDIKPYRLHEVGKKAVVKIERPLRGVALGRHLERAARAVGQGFGLFRAGPHRPRSNNCACVFANGGIAREAEVVVREIGEQIV